VLNRFKNLIPAGFLFPKNYLILENRLIRLSTYFPAIATGGECRKAIRVRITTKPTHMNLIERAKNILLTPKTEWEVVKSEEPNVPGIITGYVLPLAGVAAAAAFVGYGLIGINMFGIRIAGINWGIYQAVTVLATALISVFVSSFIIDALAPSFGSEKNMGRSVQLVAYSYTPAWVGGIFAILPSLAIIGSLAGIYGLYLLYIGLPALKKTPLDKQVGYFVVSLIVIIVVFIVIGLILSKILMSIFGLSYGVPDFKMSF
jgi:hypothetical protein